VSHPSKNAVTGHHLTEAIRHLSAVTGLVLELPSLDADVRDQLALVVEGTIETLRDVQREVEAPR
jgi:hypothetical protein